MQDRVTEPTLSKEFASISVSWGIFTCCDVGRSLCVCLYHILRRNGFISKLHKLAKQFNYTSMLFRISDSLSATGQAFFLNVFRLRTSYNLKILLRRSFTAVGVLKVACVSETCAVKSLQQYLYRCTHRVCLGARTKNQTS